MLFTKAYPKWVKDLNVNLETLKLLDENIHSAIHDKGIEKDFLTRNLFAQEFRPAIAK